MGGMNRIGFRKADFEKEVTGVLKVGVAEMSANAENPEGFVDSSVRMDSDLAVLVETFHPPPKDVESAKKRASEVIQSVIKATGIDLAPVLEKETKSASIKIVRALGYEVSFKDPINHCLEVLQQNGFGYDNAVQIISEVAEHRGPMAERISKIGQKDEFRPFLRLLDEKGDRGIKMAARNELYAIQSQPTAKIFKFPQREVMEVRAGPLRKLRH